MGSDRFGKYYRNGSYWIILAMDKRELALVNVTGIIPINIRSVGMLIGLYVLKGE